MQHDHPGSRPEDADSEHGDTPGQETEHADRSEAAQIRFLEEELSLLRRKLTESPRHSRLLEQRLAEASERVSQLTERNAKLVDTLREARSQLLALREEVDRLAQPPSGYGVFLSQYEDSTVDVFTAGRKMRVSVSPAVEAGTLRRGQSVRLNEALTVVEGGGFERTGEVSTLRELLTVDGEEIASRALVVGHADEERVVWLADPLIESTLKPGDSLLVDTKSGYAYERVPKAEVEDLVLEEVPDVDYSDIGGLFRQIEQIRDAVELPFLHKDLFAEYELRPPKGVLLYG
ncbi:MAG: proteasome ATPase, partial [Actinomycetota bacterium]|nr:proteasome ATPase [Actinomycetota bacterium]